MASARSYTISEAAGLTGLHGNTIRKRIKQGALEATVRQGKFGEEYRITYEALVAAGLIADAGPRRSGGADLVLEPEWVRDAPPPEAGSGADPGSTALQRAAEGLEGSALTPAGAAALNDLFQRHEQAIYRLGYLQAEVDRLKEIEEQARALEVVSRDQEKEVQELRHSLALRESEAAEAERLRAQLAAKAAEAAEAERLRAQLAAREAEAAEAERLKRELALTQDRVRDLQTVRRDLDELQRSTARQQELLRALEEKQNRRPWWRFFG